MFEHSYSATASALTFRHFLVHRDEINFNPDYQRDYVWGDTEQQEFLRTVFSPLPVAAIALVESPDEDYYYELVDGKQRITTMLMFVDGEIGLRIDDGSTLYWRDLEKRDQSDLKNRVFSCYMLKNNNGGKVTRQQKLHFFYNCNFRGVPQSPEHKAKIERMLQACGD